MRSSSPKTQTPALLIGIVDDRNLIVQRPEIIDVTDTKDTKRAQINNTADPFPKCKIGESQRNRGKLQDSFQFVI